MSDRTFKAMVVRETDTGSFTRDITSRRISELPEGDLLVRVHYSALNYKDALSASGNRGVTRHYPHTPGIDAAGIVEESSDTSIAVGTPVAVTGYDLGMNTPGGFAEYIRIPAGWAMPLPPELDLRESMILGTAGMTAGLAIEALAEGGIQPGGGPVLVTGATGGVGSLALMMLSQLGYETVAATGKPGRTGDLEALGASRVIARESILQPRERMLLKAEWAGVIDTVAGPYLDAALRAARRHAIVTTCGMIASATLETTIFPFILRGVRLVGIDQAETPIEHKRALLAKLASAWKPRHLERIASDCTLDRLSGRIDDMLEGRLAGRTVVSPA